jgi:hypothetical protein
MSVSIDMTLIANERIRAGLQNGTMKLFGSVVRDAKNGKIIKHLPEIGKAGRPNNPIVLFATVVIATAALGVGIYSWLRGKNTPYRGVAEASNALEVDLKSGTLDLKTAKNLRDQLENYIKSQNQKEVLARMSQEEIDDFKNLLTLLEEVNNQIPKNSLEYDELQGSILCLNQVLQPQMLN